MDDVAGWPPDLPTRLRDDLLAAPPARYAEYVAGVRREDASVRQRANAEAEVVWLTGNG